MHDVAVVGVAAEDIGDNFAKSHRENSLVDVFYCVVDVFLSSADAAHHISVVHKPFSRILHRWGI